MRIPAARVIALGIIAAVIGVTGCFAQGASAPAAPSTAALAPEQLDQLVAPVALYPDPLLADVLTASTYPLEVVEADRWVADPDNAALTGDDLTDALDAQDWDPSVKSLLPFPDVLQLMDGHLDWMEELGEVFLAQPDGVMQAVQRLRVRAEGAGNLGSNDEETVANDNGEIDVSAPPSNEIYVPEYDPWCAFGDWPTAPSPPYYFAPWPGTCEPSQYAIDFAPGVFWPFAWWDWGYFDWRNHHILIHQEKYDHFRPGLKAAGDVWKHEPTRHAGMPDDIPHDARAFGRLPGRVQSFRAHAGAAGTLRQARPPAHFGPTRVDRIQRGVVWRRGIAAKFGRGAGIAPRASPSARRGH
ncbi:MAG TPA: DUF3300 domain-containing protein [Rhizomicrobium sp.]|jgi:hypothetical protein|nr:DUF3300 domain-containing protein [Rhizomicrobium sp.]